MVFGRSNALQMTPYWPDLIKIKHVYAKGRTMIARGGKQTDTFKNL